MGASRPISIFLLLCFCACIVQSSKIVTHLPGYNGPLPFSLETGYVTVDEVNGGKLFYYFIESEGNPSEDPVVLWLTGGHRCSALSGLIFEIGPLKIVKAPYNGRIPALEYHPYAWTKNASIIFLDSPLGAGFSYSSDPKGYEVGDTMACLQIRKFLMKWFMDHPNYLAHPFYVAGDSYAGKIVPVVVQLISEGIESGRKPLLNLKGYLVGNPSTGENIDTNSRVPYAHGVGIISDQLFELTQERCVGEDYANPNTVRCAEVLDVVEDLTLQVSRAHILEPHCILVSPTHNNAIQNRRFLKAGYSVQLSKPAEPPFYCRSYSYYLLYFWANDNDAQEALGIEKGTKEEWQRCLDLPYEIDIHSNIKYHYNLTSRGYRALVYSGDHDLVVPFLGTQTWVRSLNFPVVDAWRAWYVEGETAGFTETYSNNLTFATIRGTKEEWHRCPHLPYEYDINSSIKYHYNLTSRGYRALVYRFGSLFWVHKHGFALDAWRVDGQTAGFTETYSNNLTFATVRNGGHTAPEYRPVECLAIFERWVSYKPL